MAEVVKRFWSNRRSAAMALSFMPRKLELVWWRHTQRFGFVLDQLGPRVPNRQPAACLRESGGSKNPQGYTETLKLPYWAQNNYGGAGR
jgi:hypothetical protein